MHLHNKKGLLKFEICERLKFARKDAGYRTAKIFAEKNHLKISTYTLHEAGTRSISFDLIELYSSLLKINPNWLLSGLGAKSINQKRNVPILDYSEIGAYPTVANLKSRRWATSDIDFSPLSLALVLSDDSMNPRFTEGTILIIDCNQKHKIKDLCLILNNEKKIYCFKQLVQIDEKLHAKSINSDYETYVITKNHKIIGKIVQAILTV